MAGGQYFKGNVRKRAAALCGEPKDENCTGRSLARSEQSVTGTGAVLYEFDIPQLRTWRASWRAAMDTLTLSPAQRREVVDECVRAFLWTEKLLPPVAHM